MDPEFDLPEDLHRRLYDDWSRLLEEARQRVYAERLLETAGLHELMLMLRLKRGCRR